MPIDSGQTRVLSPELVLVDRDLGAWARLRLQEEAVAARVAAPVVVAPPAVTDSELLGGSEPYLQERSLLPVAAATMAAAAIIAGVSFALHRATGRPSRSTAAAGTTPATPIPFSWARVPGARRYVFTLSRGSSVIYRAETAAVQLTVKRSWSYRGQNFTLAPGAYRWRVAALGSGSKGSRVVFSAPFSLGANG